MKKLIILTLLSVLFSITSFALTSIIGAAGVCTGSSTTLSDATGGGTWSSSTTVVATVGLTSGVTFGVSPGTTTITYTVGGVSVTKVFTVTAPPASITGVFSQCVGLSNTLSDATSGGTWSSDDVFTFVIGNSSGIDTAVSAGTADIYYTVGPGCAAIVTVTAITTPTPDSAYGPASVCAGSSITMSDMTSGGTWISANTAIATINPTSGYLTGITPGGVLISYEVSGVCGIAYAPTAFVSVVTTPVAGTVSGPSIVCVGSSITLSDAATGGVWSSSNTAVATVPSYVGTVTGVSSGFVNISYTVTNACGTAHAFQTESVTPGVSAGTITGPTTVCAGSTITLSDAVTGGVWSSSSTAIATVGTGGVVTGIAVGSVMISYGVTGTCGTVYAIAYDTVITTVPPDSITGPATVCLGSTITLSDLTTGGIWSSSNTAIATVGSGTGVVTGVSTGSVYTTYTVTGPCGSAYMVDSIAVISTVSPGTITGPTTVMVGYTTTWSDVGASGSGTWSSGNTAIATINASSGLISGVALGTATITYTVTGCGGTGYTTAVITVIPVNIISGNVNFTGASYSGPVKVWLITYDSATHILLAVDSTTVYSTGTTAFYQFIGEPTDSFRMKAVTDSAIIGTYGYIPTYHTSYYYWDSATVLYHVTGTIDAGQDINMLSGIVTGGPGFIGGNVYSGANKGTAGEIPVAGMQMYCLNAFTGAVIQQTTTDVSGAYVFSDLTLGVSYSVHPEDGGYLTTDYPPITLTTGDASMSNASFIQHTISHTITPIGTAGVNNLKNVTAAVITYPNPTSGELNIQWQEPTAEKASVTISDITGREVFKSSIDMNQGSGMSQVDLSELTTGLYMISIKSPAINYNNKIMVQR